MKNLENTLTILETNANDFDVDVFIEEFMSIPFQIEKIHKGIDTLSSKDVKRYFAVLDTLKKEALNAKPKNQLQKNVIQDILVAINGKSYEQVA